MRRALSSILASCSGNLKLALNGAVGVNYSSCYLTIIVRLTFFLTCRFYVTERYVILVVMTKPKEKDGVTKYHVNRRVRGPVCRYMQRVEVFSSSLSHWTF
jgi:hypothetical protein